MKKALAIGLAAVMAVFHECTGICQKDEGKGIAKRT